MSLDPVLIYAGQVWGWKDTLLYRGGRSAGKVTTQGYSKETEVQAG